MNNSKTSCKYVLQGKLSPNADDRFPDSEYCGKCGYCYCCNNHIKCMEGEFQVEENEAREEHAT